MNGFEVDTNSSTDDSNAPLIGTVPGVSSSGSGKTDPQTVRRDSDVQYIRDHLIVLFDFIVDGEPELLEKVVNKVLDIARNRWIEQRVKRPLVRRILLGGSYLVRPFSRQVGLRYIRESFSEVVVDAIIAEMLRIIEVDANPDTSSQKGENAIVDILEPRIPTTSPLMVEGTGEILSASGLPTSEIKDPSGIPASPNDKQGVVKNRARSFSGPQWLTFGAGLCVGALLSFALTFTVMSEVNTKQVIQNSGPSSSQVQ